MKRTLLISVAAIALAAGGNAFAQGKGGPGAAGGTNAPMANPSGPAGGAPSAAEPQATESPGTHPGAKNRGAQERSVPEKQKSTQAPATGKQLPQQGQAEHPNGTKQGAAEQREGGTKQGAAERHDGGTKQGANERHEGTKQGAAERPMTSKNVSLTTEQKTTIRTTVLTSSAPRVSGRVNFDIKIGVVVPRTVRVAPVPATLISIEPEWRGYMYFVYADEIIVVEPRTLRIVAVLEV